MAFARRDVGEDLLVQEGDRVSVQIAGHFGQESLHELPEEGGQKFLEEAIVVHVGGRQSKSAVSKAKAETYSGKI